MNPCVAPLREMPYVDDREPVPLQPRQAALTERHLTDAEWAHIKRLAILECQAEPRAGAESPVDNAGREVQLERQHRDLKGVAEDISSSQRRSSYC